MDWSILVTITNTDSFKNSTNQTISVSDKSKNYILKNQSASEGCSVSLDYRGRREKSRTCKTALGKTLILTKSKRDYWYKQSERKSRNYSYTNFVLATIQ